MTNDEIVPVAVSRPPLLRHVRNFTPTTRRRGSLSTPALIVIRHSSFVLPSVKRGAKA